MLLTAQRSSEASTVYGRINFSSPYFTHSFFHAHSWGSARQAWCYPSKAFDSQKYSLSLLVPSFVPFFFPSFTPSLPASLLVISNL